VEQDALQKAALEMLRESRRAEGLKIAERSADVLRPDYWTGLCPDMSVSGRTEFELPQTGRFDPATFGRDGYFMDPGVLPIDDISALLAAIEQLRKEGWHPLFAFVFDQFWALAWTGAIRGAAAAILGPNPLLIPRLAVHYVHTEDNSQGWAPHTDGEPSENRLTTWIPLTDATLTNGCIYVVPRSEAVGEAMARFTKADTTHVDATRLLQHARALPAAAGSVLGWGFDVLHWGSLSLNASAPRVSVAYEWLGRDGSPEPEELPLLNLDDGLPALTERLDLIARSVLSYIRFDSALLPFVELAKQLRSSASAGG
jgi:hypothetical protein